MKRIFFTVTNDLTYDQRMIRICNSLANEGHRVTLVGRRLNSSVPLVNQPFAQKRLPCFFTRGKAFYIEFNLRLFFFLLFQKIECICAVDLDTIMPCYGISILKKIPRVYDAHELFCEMKEIVTRAAIYSIWKKVEKFSVPKFHHGYTVNGLIAEEFKKMYRVNYAVIRNFPVLEPLVLPEKKEKYILYQGAVNHGRSFETLIPAMAHVDCQLMIFGDGNFMEEAKELVKKSNLTQKVLFKGKLPPAELKKITRNAWIGLTLFENNGMSNYLSLANRFSDYIHAGVPQLCVNYPLYSDLNNQYHIAVLLDDLDPANIAKSLNALLKNESLYREMQQNCLLAREKLNWQKEESELISFYKNIFEHRG
jgi:glycosyltransferase involved in cell wall biosynthesis